MNRYSKITVPGKENVTLITANHRNSCYKNANNPSCIDLFLTNSTAIETGLSDFHKMTITIMKTVFKKKKPKIIQYRDYKNLSNIVFRSGLMDLLYIHNVNNIHYNDFDNLVMGLLMETCIIWRVDYISWCTTGGINVKDVKL